jgi:hypothetical protein
MLKREVLLSPVKEMFLCSKLPCLGWRSADFLQGFFAKNIFWTNANLLVLALRFLWPLKVDMDWIAGCKGCTHMIKLALR